MTAYETFWGGLKDEIKHIRPKPLSIMASIKPVHALVAGLMDDFGTPHLLLVAPSSVHYFTLKPSQACALQNADIMFWIGP